MRDYKQVLNNIQAVLKGGEGLTQAEANALVSIIEELESEKERFEKLQEDGFNKMNSAFIPSHRQYLAAAAMRGIVANQDNWPIVSAIVSGAYSIADAMIAFEEAEKVNHDKE